MSVREKCDEKSWEERSNTPCTFYGTLRHGEMAPERTPRKVELVFFRNDAGSEPVRDWLKDMDEAERRAIGTDLLRAQWRWPVGMPLCRPMGKGLWEVRTDLPSNRTARVLICFYQGRLVALHGFIKKTRATPEDDLALARRRRKELES
jgi:phage-related protein